MTRSIEPGWVGGHTSTHQASRACGRCGRTVSAISLRRLTRALEICVGCLRSDPAWSEAELRAAWGDR